jgi:L-fucose mutarotase
MLKYRLLHPELLAALAAAGHGSRVLLADANYPHDTGAPAAARRIYLNLAPGLLRVTDVLAVLAEAVPLEAAHFMLQDDGQEAPIIAEFRRLLPDLTPAPVERFAFYDLARGPLTSILVATGEQRLYANLLLTVGYIKPDEAALDTNPQQPAR